MIITHKDIDLFKIKIGRNLKLSDDYTFIPVNIKKDNNCSVIQTPYMYIPYGIKKIDEKKLILDLSFMNISNDNDLSSFYDLLKNIEDKINNKYENIYKVNKYLRNTAYNFTMRTKLNNAKFFNKYKQTINTIHSGSYGRFIIELHGLWLHNKEIWFQWYLIQGETNDSLITNKYMFLDTLETSVNNYKPPPPPPPLPNFKKTTNKIIINKSRKKNIVEKNSGFAPPSLEELQITLSKLKNIK